MRGADLIHQTLSDNLARQKVVRFGDSLTSESAETCVSVMLLDTAFSESIQCPPVVLSEDVMVACYSDKSIAQAHQVSDAVDEVLFDPAHGLRASLLSRRESAESETSGGYRIVESTYRVWAE